MKRLLSFTIILLTLSTVTGQTTENNVLTSEHQNIVGTKISIIPPIGFIKADNFLGLQQTQSGATIMVLDIPAPFAETSKGLTKEGFLSQGVEVKTIKKLTLNNLPAIFVIGEQNAYSNTYTKYILCFGTEKETIMINGAIPSNLEKIAKEVKTSILSSFYEENKKIDPFEVLDYEIDVSKSKMIYAKGMSNTMTFNIDGLLPTKSQDKTSLFIAKSFSKIPVEDKKLFALNRLKQLPINIINIENTETIEIDTISGYQILLTTNNKKTNEPEKIYFVILFSDNLYYILYGSTNNTFDKNIDELKKVVKTFKRKLSTIGFSR